MTKIPIALAGLLISASVSEAGGIRDVPAGFDFPASSAQLESDRYDEHKMRLHGWMVLAGVSHTDCDHIPVFQTWYSPDQTLTKDPPSPHLPLGLPALEEAQQFTLGYHDVIGQNPPLVSVLFNRAAHDFIRCERLYDKTHLDDLLKSTSDVPSFPNDSVAIKAVWWPIRKRGLSVIPVWDNSPTKDVESGVGAPSSKSPRGNDYTTWKRVVLIDPTNGTVPYEKREKLRYFDYRAANPIEKYRDVSEAKVVQLSQLYSFQLSPKDIESYGEQLNDFRELFRRLYDPPRDIEDGDSIALVALHVATKEIPDWFWATFWWHDEPNGSAFAADRPSAVQGAWRNYLMDVTIDTDVPREPDRRPNITFNPWLEGGLYKGLVSNCMACHQRSAWPLDNVAQKIEVVRGRLPLDDHYYQPSPNDPEYQNRKIRLDYLWSLTRTPATTQPAP